MDLALRHAASPRPRRRATTSVPYDDTAKALESAKVLVPYANFVRVWNLAEPDKPLESAPPVKGAAMADVRYEVKLVKSADPSQGPGTLQITLHMQVLALAAPLKRPVVIAMPLGGIAVFDATFAGKPAAFQVGPGGDGPGPAPRTFRRQGQGQPGHYRCRHSEVRRGSRPQRPG